MGRIRDVRLFGAAGLLLASAAAAAAEPWSFRPAAVRDLEGAVIRGDVRQPRLALIFTGDVLAESTPAVLDTLAERRIKAGFFLTGNFLRNPRLEPLVARMVEQGHYVGPHSDAHLLYCPWEDRHRSLVAREVFQDDLNRNLAALRERGALAAGQPVLFVPPYEWYNAQHVEWAKAMNVHVINFTPGSGSNRDYLRENDPRFVASRVILDDILAYEQQSPHGFSGFVLLLHLGSGRKDPFHPLLGELCDTLAKRGYRFDRVDRLLGRDGPGG